MRDLKHFITTLMLATLLVFGAGCATQETATEKDFGKSVRSMITEQTLNPTNAMLPDPQPIDEGNGERLNNAIEAYKADVSNPVEQQ